MVKVIEHNHKSIIFVGDEDTLIDLPKAKLIENDRYIIDIVDITKPEMSQLYIKISNFILSVNQRTIETSRPSR